MMRVALYHGSNIIRSTDQKEHNMAVAPDLETVADKIALTELVARLEQAVDRMDREGILACYSERSFDDHAANLCCSPRGEDPG